MCGPVPVQAAGYAYTVAANGLLEMAKYYLGRDTQQHCLRESFIQTVSQTNYFAVLVYRIYHLKWRGTDEEA